jgi:hypothetical protein
MATEIPNLWNLELGQPQTPTPVSVLRKQATSLGELTGGMVVGKVETVSTRNTINHRFSLFAPLLSYSYPLFSVTHDGVHLYPVKISGTGGGLDYHVEAEDYPSFVNEIRAILSDEGVKEAIEALVAQSRE